MPRLTVYSAKFLCGEFRPSPEEEKAGLGPVKSGNYATAINVHNPTPWKTVHFIKKAVLMFAGTGWQPAEETEVPRPPGHMVRAELPPDFGMEIDCFDIRKVLLDGKIEAPVFIKGWVILETWEPWPLDVEVVYTAHTFQGDRPEGFSITTERVPGVAIPFLLVPHN